MARTATPLGDRVLVRRVAKVEATPGGIVLPDGSQEKPVEGLVVAVGTGHRYDDGRLVLLEVTVGDTVLFSTYAGTEVKVDGEEYVIMTEADVLAVLGG